MIYNMALKDWRKISKTSDENIVYIKKSKNKNIIGDKWLYIRNKNFLNIEVEITDSKDNVIERKEFNHSSESGRNYNTANSQAEAFAKNYMRNN